MVHGSQSTRDRHATRFGTGKKSGIQFDAAHARRRTANRRAGPGRIDERDSRCLVITLRNGRDHWWHVLRESGSDHGHLSHGAWSARAILAARVRELVYGRGLWRPAPRVWCNYCEEIRWLNNQLPKRLFRKNRSARRPIRKSLARRRRVRRQTSIV